MGKRLYEFIKTAGILGGGSVMLSLICFAVTFREHILDHNVPASVFGLLTIVFFCIGAFLAWNSERGKRVEGEKKWEDQRPRLGLEANSYDGENTWAKHNNPVTFRLKLLSGRVPESIHFDPIPSKSGRFILEFGAVPHVEPLQQKVMTFDVVEVGKPALSAKDREATFACQKDMLLLFLSDLPECSGEVQYPLVVRFLDRNEHREQAFNLRWDWAKYGFGSDTV
jgi:hypothetical protein